jgi:hypothetical protein
MIHHFPKKRVKRWSGVQLRSVLRYLCQLTVLADFDLFCSGVQFHDGSVSCAVVDVDKQRVWIELKRSYCMNCTLHVTASFNFLCLFLASLT